MIHLVLLLGRIWMNQDIQRAAMDDQPRNERAKHGRAENVDFEHGDGVWAHWLVPEGVNAEFGNWRWLGRQIGTLPESQAPGT